MASVMPGEKIPGETMVQSAMSVIGDVWDSLKSLVVRRKSTEGYRQIPVEMNESV